MVAIAAIQLLVKIWGVKRGVKVVKSAVLLRRIKLHDGIVLQLRIIAVCSPFCGFSLHSQQ